MSVLGNKLNFLVYSLLGIKKIIIIHSVSRWGHFQNKTRGKILNVNLTSIQDGSSFYWWL